MSAYISLEKHTLSGQNCLVNHTILQAIMATLFKLSSAHIWYEMIHMTNMQNILNYALIGFILQKHEDCHL